MHPKVLIIGTVPYNPNSSSRAFDAYFHYWEKENLRQIFSNSKKPIKGHCGSLYQITDARMLKKWFNKKIDTGKIYMYDDLPEQWNDNDLEIGNKNIENAYKFGRKHTPLTHLLRGLLWRKKYWCTPQFEMWLQEFNPSCVFLAFSDDFFINQIALYVSKKFNIPIISCIGDDYYFNKHFSINPIYQIYKESYKRLVRKIFDRPGSAIYISEKIRKKYNTEFNLDGEVVYLTSNMKRKKFQEIDTKKPIITYFGNIRMGRNHSLIEIGKALKQINQKYCIEVYSNERDDKYFSIFDPKYGVDYKGNIPYGDVMKRMAESDITIIVEGFKKKDIELSRYSLSTKAADALASGAQILVYGSSECGIVEYMSSINAAMVCTNKNNLTEKISTLLSNKRLQENYYNMQIEVSNKNHNIASSSMIFEKVLLRTLNKK